jgi:hypothetical protein
MHGYILLFYFICLTIIAGLNIPYIIYFRKKFNLSIIQVIIYNLILYFALFFLALILFNIMMHYHDEIGCETFSSLEGGIMYLLAFFPLSNFAIKRHRRHKNTYEN